MVDGPTRGSPEPVWSGRRLRFRARCEDYDNSGVRVMAEAVETLDAGPRPGSQRGQPTHDVFVSYSTPDKPVADAIVSRLEQAGIRCWVAPRDVLPGMVWGDAIVRAIETARLMVVVVSGDSNESTHVHREVGRAIEKDVVVVPVRIESVEPTGVMAYYLASEHWLDAMSPPLESHICRLVQVAQALLETAQAPPPQQPAEAATPVPPTVPRRTRVWAIGLVVAAAVAALGVLALLAWSLFAPPDPEEPVAGAEEPVAEAEETVVNLEDLAEGDCVLTPATNAADPRSFWATDIAFPPTMTTVPCGAPHGGEVFFVEDAWGADEEYPGYETIEEEWWDTCDREFAAYTGVEVFRQHELEFTGWYPVEWTWLEGDREVLCIAYPASGEELEASIRR
jgi:hypothetical protein